MIKVILALILFTSIAFADQPVTYLQKGQPAPQTGYLFSPEQELKLRTTFLENERLTQLTVKQTELISVLDQRLELQLKVNQNLREQNQFNQETTVLTKVLWFGAGVLLTGTAAYLIRK